MKTRLKRFARMLAGLTIFCSSTAAIADDACTIIAKQGLYDTHVTKSSTQSFAQFKSNFCSWYSSYRESHTNDKADVKIPIADIPIGISNDLTFGEADAMKSGLCSATASSNYDQNIWSDVTRYINPAAVTAFTDCVKATHGGLSVTPNVNDDETLYTISVAYHAPDGGNPTTITKVTAAGWLCDKPKDGSIDIRDYVGKEGKFENKQVGMVCKRDVKPTPYTYAGLKVVADPAMISVQTYAGSYTQYFRPKIYEDPLADTAKVMASYPRGTILPFAGHIAEIPAGWHICDGTAGTVNLIDYIPYGAKSDDQIDAAAQGKHEGSLTHTHTQDNITGRIGANNDHVVQDDHATLTVPGIDIAFSPGAIREANNLPPTTRVYFIQKIGG